MYRSKLQLLFYILATSRKKKEFLLWHSGSGYCRGAGSIPSPVQWVKGSSIATAAICVDHSCSSDLVPIQELPYTKGVAINFFFKVEFEVINTLFTEVPKSQY